MAKTLLEKLGFAAGMIGWVSDRPDAFASSLGLSQETPNGHADLIVSFVTRRADIVPALDLALPHYARGSRLWFAYPKKSGGIRSDISRDDGWAPLIAVGLLPVTQIALDDDWSALRFRYRDEIARLTRKSDTHNPPAA